MASPAPMTIRIPEDLSLRLEKVHEDLKAKVPGATWTSAILMVMQRGLAAADLLKELEELSLASQAEARQKAMDFQARGEHDQVLHWMGVEAEANRQILQLHATRQRSNL